MQETQNVEARSNQQRETEDTTKTHQQSVAPQPEALQAQINALQAQLAQQSQQNQRTNPYQQAATVDPLTVVGPWQHTEQQPMNTTQLMGQPHNNQGTKYRTEKVVHNPPKSGGNPIFYFLRSGIISF